MRHQLATADSDKYDRRTHDRLNESAVQFAEMVARKYTTVPVPEGYTLVPNQPASYEFVKGDAGFVCTIDFDGLQSDTIYRWAAVPGLKEGFSWKTPVDVAGKRLTVTLPSCDVKAAKFTVTNLLVKSEAPPTAPPLAPTEVIDENPVIDDLDDEWVPIEAELTATRTEGDTFTVTLPTHNLLIPNCEVRIVDTSVVEQSIRLPEATASGTTAYEITIRIPDAEGDSVTLTGLETKPPAPVAKARPQSMVKPSIPIMEAHAMLKEARFEKKEAARNGDCFALSAMAGFELKDLSEVMEPRLYTIEVVGDAREASVDLLTGDAPIGGIDASVVRENEGLDDTSILDDWKTLGHWRPREDQAGASTAFMFGVACHLKRPVIVMEKQGGGILDPCFIYGNRKDGELITSPPRGGVPETIPFVKQIPFADVLTAVKANPRGYSLVEYDREERHHSPMIYTPEEAAQEMHAAEDKQVAEKAEEVDKEAAEEKEELSLPMSIPGIFDATPAVESKKMAVGKRAFVLTMPWGEGFVRGAKLSVYVHATGKMVNVTLPARLPSGNVEIVLVLPDTVTSPARVGPITMIPPAPKAVPPPPKPSTALPKPMPPPPKPPPKPAPKPQSKPPPKPPPTKKTRQASPKLTPVVTDPPASRYGRKRKAKEMFGDGGEQDGPASKFKSAAIAPKPFVSMADEIEVPSFCAVGAKIQAIGYHGSTHKLFTATVKSIRAKFPRIVVEFTADADGSTHQLSLPEPRVAYVHAGMVQEI